MNDRLSKILLALVAVALWGILIRSFFNTPALQAKPIVSQALTASVVTACAFQLVNSKGEACGSLTSNDQGNAILFLGHTGRNTGRNSVSLYTDGINGSLDMTDYWGQRTVSLSAHLDYSGPLSGGHLSLRADKDETELACGRMALTQGVDHITTETGRVAIPLDAGSKSFIELDNVQVPPKSVGH
jgi:hypothetical protein